MDNHYHLLIETLEPTLSRGMREVNCVYTQAFNRWHGRVGHVLQGRYKAVLVDKDSYPLELSRYIVLNPVRARLCPTAADWPWSSYLAVMGKAAPDTLAVNETLPLFAPDRGAARRAFARREPRCLCQRTSSSCSWATTTLWSAWQRVLTRPRWRCHGNNGRRNHSLSASVRLRIATAPSVRPMPVERIA